MTRHAWSERQQLCELERLGPDAPTLCEGWATRTSRLISYFANAAPDLGIGAYVPPLAGRLERERRKQAHGDYHALAARVRAGRPGLEPDVTPEGR